MDFLLMGTTLPFNNQSSLINYQFPRFVTELSFFEFLTGLNF
jgi:hypothetical protein